MAPRLGSRGKSRPAAAAADRLERLQWRHDWGVVERPKTLAEKNRDSRFNGATTGESWKALW